MQSTPPDSQDYKDSTPLMKQYWELKSQARDALLFFRMGDFYELFGDDAVEAARILEITLTSRDRNKPNPTPMAGVPHHSAQSYIQRLLNAGKKVAIGEQMEDPQAAAKGPTKIVRREIIRILTPGVQFDAEGSEINFLAALIRNQHKTSGAPTGTRSNSRLSSLWTLACLDASTGEVLMSESAMDLELARAEISKRPIKHLLVIEGDVDTSLFGESLLVETLPKNYLNLDRAVTVLKKNYGVGDLQAFLPNESACLALGILVTYALRTQQQDSMAHLRLPEPLHKPTSLVLGPHTAEHLDLDDLFSLINKTRSTLGARQLKRWLNAPLRDPKEICNRQEAVRALASSNFTSPSSQIMSELSKLYDIERIMGRVNTRLANPRDSYALGVSLSSLPGIIRSLGTLVGIGLFGEMQQSLTQIQEKIASVRDKILRFQIEEAPLVSRDGGIFKKGMNPTLDRLLSLNQDGQNWLIQLETQEREKTGIPSLKVRYNRVFGYYIEITQAHLKNVPAHYQRKQTMVGAERFFTEELKKFEEEILTASMKQKSLEQELFHELLNEIQSLTTPIMSAAQILGELDALYSLSHLASQPGWKLPTIDSSLDLSIRRGRHPLVDASRPGHFVPNDLDLNPRSKMTLLITGPNMGGKSTVMRQTALIVILGQIGAPVPADEAQWGTVSSVYTRIGAQDAIARGQSTFMVEMSELAHILHHADARSLIILDEIGRGTSTYDGISVAWASLEWICTKTQARTLFATHYHELVQLSSSLPVLSNAHMAVDGGKSSGALRFLYELRDGPTNDSFGIQVAELAGLPKPVIQKAWKILTRLENHVPLSGNGDSSQLSLFNGNPGITEFAPPEPPEDVPPHPAVLELEQIDIDTLTPIQALNTLAKLKELIRNDGTSQETQVQTQAFLA